VSERPVWRIAGIFTPTFWPPVILAALAVFVGLDVLIIARDRLAVIVQRVDAGQFRRLIGSDRPSPRSSPRRMGTFIGSPVRRRLR
jgi:hypothetical protein